MQSRVLHLFLCAIFALGSDFSTAAAQSRPRGWAGEVVAVVDGDTVVVRPRRGGPPRTVRLVGLDAPERCQAGGDAAREALAERVLHQPVQVQGRGKDSYGRDLARLIWQGEDLGSWLVVQGHAWSNRWRGRTGPYDAEEIQARLARRGVFQQVWAEHPRDFRRRHGRC